LTRFEACFLGIVGGTPRPHNHGARQLVAVVTPEQMMAILSELDTPDTGSCTLSTQLM